LQWFSICCCWMWLQRSQRSSASYCKWDLFAFIRFRVDHGKDSYTTLPKPIDSTQELRVGMLWVLQNFLTVIS